MNPIVWLEEEPGRQSQVAAHFGVSRSAVSQWKTNGVPVQHMRAFSELSGGKVSLEALIRHSSEGSSNDAATPAKAGA